MKKQQEGKLKALEAAMSKIEKDFGKGSIMRMGDEQVEDVDVIPTGSIGLDAALGVGGYPRGRIIEIYGPESSGKTTLAIHAIAEAQKMGGIAAFIDAEHAFDRFYAQKQGVGFFQIGAMQFRGGVQHQPLPGEDAVLPGAQQLLAKVAQQPHHIAVDGNAVRQHQLRMAFHAPQNVVGEAAGEEQRRAEQLAGPPGGKESRQGDGKR